MLISEFTVGHPRGNIQVDVRNDGLNVLNCIHGLTSIQQEKRLTATIATLREALSIGDVNTVGYIYGPINLADDLTKATSGENIFNLMTKNIVPVLPFSELKNVWRKSANKKQYIFEQLAQTEYKIEPTIAHRTRFTKRRVDREN